jgi:S1-C subfamily serine protease
MARASVHPRVVLLAAVVAIAVVSSLGVRSACAEDAPTPAAKPAERGVLGFEATHDGTQVVARNVAAGGAADVAGISDGDVILKVAGKDVPLAPEGFSAAFARITDAVTVGEKVEVVVARDGKPVTLTLTAVAARGYCGFQATPSAILSVGEKRRWHVKAPSGVVAIHVGKGSPAAKGGLKNGDRILSYAGQDAPSTTDVEAFKSGSLPAFEKAFAKIAATTRAGVETSIVVERDGKPVTLNVTPATRAELERISEAAGGKEEGDDEPEKPPGAPQSR